MSQGVGSPNVTGVPRVQNAPGAASALVRRIGKLLALSDEERDFLEVMQGQPRSVTPRHDLWQLGDELHSTLVVRDGWVARYRLMPDGRRQIVSFALPGDILALHVNFRRAASYDVATVNSCSLSYVPPSTIDRLYRGYPRLAAVINWTVVRDYAVLAEHVVRLGRQHARERLLHGLLELWQRLDLVDATCEHDFVLPLTQGDLGDWLGLSVPHVNRTLKGLQAEGLILREKDHIILAHVPRMIEVADYRPAMLEDFAL